MSEHNITVEGGSSVRLPTAGKYCDRDIVVTATGGGIPEGYYDATGLDIDESKVLEGEIYIDENGYKIGTMPQNSQMQNTISYDGYDRYDIPEGYHPSGGYVQVEWEDATVTPSKSKQIITPGKRLTLHKVTVNPIPDEYIIPQGEKEITENGQYDVSSFASVNVNVAGGGDEGTNAQWYADLITDSARSIEIYNDKFEGTLSAYAFYERSNVTKIELPNLQYLKERCFYGCQNLKTLLLPQLVGYTYQYMASGCTALVDVDIHDTSYVSSYTFQNCSSLKKVDLHRVGTIATYAFTGATKLETLIIRTDTVPTLGGTNAFTNTKIKSGGTGYIYVKSALLDEFKSASNWSNFSTQFRAIEDYPEICG